MWSHNVKHTTHRQLLRVKKGSKYAPEYYHLWFFTLPFRMAEKGWSNIVSWQSKWGTQSTFRFPLPASRPMETNQQIRRLNRKFHILLQTLSWFTLRPYRGSHQPFQSNAEKCLSLSLCVWMYCLAGWEDNTLFIRGKSLDSRWHGSNNGNRWH